MYKTIQRSFIILAAATLLGAPLAGAQNRKVPKIYKRSLSRLLTPVEEVLEQAKDFKPASDQAGVVLLNERIHFVQPDGSRYMVSHLVFKALGEAGVKAIAEDTFSYRKTDQKMTLVSARTISPDGTSTPVRPNAVMVQSPQDQADMALYNDSEELRVIFPKVMPGAVTESITLVEEKSPRMEGEFSAVFAWASFWPRMTKRRVVELPGDLAGRLQVVNTGSGIDEPRKQKLKNGRVRYTWELGRSQGMVFEPRRAPPLQTGPATWLTTLSDWDAFAAWYTRLIEGRAALSPKLAKQVDAWTEGLEKKEDILAALFTQVANEVRYTGLEFGISALQPYECNEVWDNRYGDCKDKSNLLRAMLAHKNIASFMTLLQTSHAGRIEKGSPSYQQFDHAILAVDTGGEAYTFCDPTIARARPGMLAPSGADRDVLLIKDGKAEWVRTPVRRPGRTTYALDLKWQADGALSGWMTKSNEGFYAPWFAAHFGAQSDERFDAEMAGLVRRFYPEAQLVDASHMDLEQFEERFETKAYFVSPANSQEGAQRRLSFPVDPQLLPGIGASKVRLTDRFLWMDAGQLEARIALPAGWNATDLPLPFEIDTEAFAARAEWKAETNVVTALLRTEVKQSVIPPRRYESFYQAVDALQAWLDRPLKVQVSGETPSGNGSDAALKDFVLMPTGEGQLRLVDSLFPKTGNRELRRSALEKTRQFFPNDKPTLFSVGVRIAILDWEEEKEEAASNQLKQVLEKYRNDVSASTRSWGEYILALCYRDMDARSQALSILTRLAGNADLPEFRRTWSAHQAAKLLADKDRDKAIKLLRKTFDFESGAVAENVGLYARLMAKANKAEALVTELKRIAGQNLPQYEAIVGAVVEHARLLTIEDSKAGTELEAALRKLAKDESLPAQQVLVDGLKTIQRSTDIAAVSLDIQKKMVADAKAGKLPYGDLELDEGLEGREDFERVLRNKRNDLPSYIRHCLEMLVRFPPNSQFSFYLWSCAGKQDQLERTDAAKTDPALLETLLGYSEALSPDDRWYFESRFIRARSEMRNERFAESMAVYDDLLAAKDIGEEMKMSALRPKAELLERMEKWEDALKVYAGMEDSLGKFPGIGDSLLRAVFIHLALGDRTEAFRVLDHLRGARGSLRGDNATQIYSLLEFTKDRKRAETYWKATEAWWKKFRDFLDAVGVEDPDALRIPTYDKITSVDGLGELMRARDEKGFVEAFRMVVHGARWMPNFNADAANISTFAAISLYPKQETRLREFSIALGESLDSDDPAVERQNLFLLTVNYLELRQPELALERIHAYNGMKEKNPVIERAMIRLWGMAANMSGKDLDEAGAALRGQLEDTQAGSRGMTVNSLAEILRRQGKLKEEEALLKRELEHPAIKGDDRVRESLRARYDALALEGEASEKFSRAVERWLGRQDFPWWDFAKPKSLDDRKLRKLDSVLENPGRQYTAPEQLKLFLLIATDPGQPLQRRLKVFEDGVRLCAAYITQHDPLHEMYASIYDDEDFPQQVRRDWHWRGFLDSLDERNPGRIDHYHTHELTSTFNDRQKAYAEVLVPYAKLDLDDGDALLERAEELMDEEISSSKLGVLMDLYSRLLQIDELEKAEGIYKEIREVQLAPDVRTTSRSLQLSMLKGLNKAKEMVPVHRRMRELVFKMFPEDQIEKPEGFDALRYPADAFHFDVKKRNQILLYLIKTRRFDRSTVNFWNMFTRYLVRENRSPEAVELVFTMMEEGLKLAANDLGRAEIIAMGAGTIDLDDPGERDRYWKMCKPYRDREEHPVSYSEIRFREIEMDLRLGKKLNLEKELAHLEDQLGNKTPESIRLQHYTQTRSKDLLRKTLDQIDPDDQLSRRWLSASIRAYEVLGMKDEAMLARESAEEERYKMVLGSWADSKGNGYFSVLDLSAILGTTEGVPESWYQATEKKLAYRKNLLYLRMRYHSVRKDWKQAEEAAGELVERYPNFYDYYWYHGRALYELGEKKKAVKALTTYTTYSKSDPQYPEAMELLKALQGEKE